MNKLASVLIAAAGGFVAGVLLAPKSGKETRQDILDKSRNYKGKAEDGFEEVKKGARLVKAEVTEGAKTVKEIRDEARVDATRNGERVKAEVSRRAEAIKKDVSDTTDKVKKAVK